MRKHLARVLFPVAACLGTPAIAADSPLPALPYTPGLDVSTMDKGADPCVDFYQFTCGGWKKKHPLPADQASWSVYGKLTQENQQFLWGILDELAKKTGGRNETQQKIGDYFAACMDERAVEKLGMQPLEANLERIAALKSKGDIPALLAAMHLATGDAGFFFGFGSNQDYADSSQVIAFAVSGGLGLPDRDYYVMDDAKSKAMRARYQAHVARMFQLLGDAPAVAARNAATVLRLETALAKATLTRVDKRDPYKLFHKMDRKALVAMTPGFDWNAYLAALDMASLESFNVTEPAFFAELDKQLHARSLAEIQTYLRWHLVTTAATSLSKRFVAENFAFYGKTLHGIPQLKPRWKRCVALVDGQLGEALGKEFVSRAFSAQLKEKTLRMTKQVEQAMADDINQLAWMSPATKKMALEKLSTIVNKIGYPDQWRDYGPVAVKRDDFYGNVVRAQLFESRRDLAKIGKPLDRGEWFMTPPSVNAYYNPQMNDINFAAGILQPPLYDPKMDDAPNYGNTGGTIGHELTHGFDDEGRQFDAQGNLKDWWTKEDAAAFEERAQCIVDQYSGYTIVDNIKIKGKLTNGEDIADLGGLILAYMAWKMEAAVTPPPSADGFTPEQRFFIGFAQWACENERPESLRVKALTDPHSPGKYRVNGLVVNMPEFEKAFACRKGQPMAPEKRCRVW